MSDFEDTNIISRYTRQQAVDDGILTEVLQWAGKPVMATAHIANDLTKNQMLDVWRTFQFWKVQEEQLLPEEDRLFYTPVNGKKVWVIEDTEGYTIMYPEDY